MSFFEAEFLREFSAYLWLHRQEWIYGSVLSITALVPTVLALGTACFKKAPISLAEFLAVLPTLVVLVMTITQLSSIFINFARFPSTHEKSLWTLPNVLFIHGLSHALLWLKVCRCTYAYRIRKWVFCICIVNLNLWLAAARIWNSFDSEIVGIIGGGGILQVLYFAPPLVALRGKAFGPPKPKCGFFRAYAPIKFHRRTWLCENIVLGFLLVAAFVWILVLILARFAVDVGTPCYKLLGRSFFVLELMVYCCILFFAPVLLLLIQRNGPEFGYQGEGLYVYAGSKFRFIQINTPPIVRKANDVPVETAITSL